MGSLLSVIAVTVAANAPAAVEGVAVKVRTERPPMAAADGENDAVTPPGRPRRRRERRIGSPAPLPGQTIAGPGNSAGVGAVRG